MLLGVLLLDTAIPEDDVPFGNQLGVLIVDAFPGVGNLFEAFQLIHEFCVIGELANLPPCI